jgi:hypothetical protein
MVCLKVSLEKQYKPFGPETFLVESPEIYICVKNLGQNFVLDFLTLGVNSSVLPLKLGYANKHK